MSPPSTGGCSRRLASLVAEPYINNFTSRGFLLLIRNFSDTRRSFSVVGWAMEKVPRKTLVRGEACTALARSV